MMQIKVTPELSIKLAEVKATLTYKEKVEFNKASVLKDSSATEYLIKKYLERNAIKIKKRPKIEGI